MNAIMADTSKNFDKTTEAMKKMDKVMVTENTKRIQALDKTRDAFDGINKSVKELTTSIIALQRAEKELFSARLNATARQTSNQMVNENHNRAEEVKQ